MALDTNKLRTGEEQKLPAEETGNASNPTPNDNPIPAGNQLLDKKAETYLRESANIEDMPDPQEDQEAEERMRKQNER